MGQNRHVIFLLWSLDVMDYINCSFNVKPVKCTWEQSHLVIVYVCVYDVYMDVLLCAHAGHQVSFFIALYLIALRLGLSRKMELD